jgi:hypothetical protein
VKKADKDKLIEDCAIIIDHIPDYGSELVDVADEFMPSGRPLDFYRGWIDALYSIMSAVKKAEEKYELNEGLFNMLLLCQISSAARKVIERQPK